MIRRPLTLLAAAALFVTFSAAVAQQPAEEIDLKVGDEAPVFESVDQKGEAWKSEDHVGKKIIVLYFYPKDMTGGCTAQACAYRDMMPELTDQHVEVVGVSGDTVESHQQFIEKEDLNFTLLADPEGEIAKAFGVPGREMADMFITARWTFVIDLDGNIAFKDDKVRPTEDVKNVMKVIADLPKPEEEAAG